MPAAKQQLAALVDPRTGKARWVFASRNPAGYLAKLLQPTNRLRKTHPPLDEWLRELANVVPARARRPGVKPELRILNADAKGSAAKVVGEAIVRLWHDEAFLHPRPPAVGGFGSFDPAVAARVVELRSQGRSLRQIGRLDGMPCRQVIRRWERENDEFAVAMREAHECYCDEHAEEVLEIADDEGGDFYTDSEGREVFDREAVMRAKLRIETRERHIARISARYHPRHVVSLEGNREKPVAVAPVLPPLPPELEAELREHLQRALQGEPTPKA